MLFCVLHPCNRPKDRTSLGKLRGCVGIFHHLFDMFGLNYYSISVTDASVMTFPCGLVSLCVFFCPCLDALHDEALERYMKLSKRQLNELESKVWVNVNLLWHKTQWADSGRGFYRLQQLSEFRCETCTAVIIKHLSSPQSLTDLREESLRGKYPQPKIE